MYVSFETEEKARLFDEIISHFYKQNFGQMSKSDIELMMFNIYIRKMIEQNKAEDDTIDYSKCSDYKISVDLGITQQKVRNLKVKNQLVHPIKYEWKKAFAKLIVNARYDDNTRKVILNIPDPNLYLEIQNFIEENGAYVEKQLNSKILQLRAEYFIQLAIESEDSLTKKEIIKALKKQFKEHKKDETSFDEKNIGKSLLNSTDSLLSLVNTISGFVSPKNVIAKSLFELLKNCLPQ